MHSSSSAQRLQRLRVITNNLLKSIHGFRQFAHQHSIHTGLRILIVLLILVGVQLVLWRISLSSLAERALTAPTTYQEVRAPASNVMAAVQQSSITRIEIPAADIYTPVISVGATTNQDTQASSWQFSRFALGHYAGTGLPGQGKNIVFSAESGKHARIMSLLDRVRPGSLITLYVGETAYSYTVTQQELINADTPNVTSWVDAHLLNNDAGEQVTLITDWPSTGTDHNTRYLMVVATPTP